MLLVQTQGATALRRCDRGCHSQLGLQLFMQHDLLILLSGLPHYASAPDSPWLTWQCVAKSATACPRLLSNVLLHHTAELYGGSCLYYSDLAGTHSLPEPPGRLLFLSLDPLPPPNAAPSATITLPITHRWLVAPGRPMASSSAARRSDATNSRPSGTASLHPCSCAGPCPWPCSDARRGACSPPDAAAAVGVVAASEPQDSIEFWRCASLRVPRLAQDRLRARASTELVVRGSASPASLLSRPEMGGRSSCGSR